MSLKPYVDWFHDGSVDTICWLTKDHLVIAMTSAKVDDKGIGKRIKLTNDGRIVGKLHLEGIKSLFIDDIPVKNSITKNYDSGEILDFEMVGDHTIWLGISWVDFPPKNRVVKYESIKIIADKIWWENISELGDAHLS